MGVDVETVRAPTDDVVAAVCHLLPQLSMSAVPLDAAAIARMLAWDGNTLLVARVDGEIVGMLTLVMFPIPSGLRAWIEDVVVDAAGRGRGVGAALTQEAIRLAQAEGVKSVDLTSRPSREAANRLYERLGFQVRETKLYRHAG
jgi:ribosomal protein S18 acetylase RimI-like enzyme